MGWMSDETGLDKCAANYVPLTPLSHLRRAAHVFKDHTAVVYGDHRATYGEYMDRVTQLASGLANGKRSPCRVSGRGEMRSNSPSR